MSMKKLILATASVLVIGIGATAMSHAGNVGKHRPESYLEYATKFRISSVSAGCRGPVKRRHQPGAARAATCEAAPGLAEGRLGVDLDQLSVGPLDDALGGHAL